MKLFSPTQLGPYQLRNHLVMAPMTRSRALQNIANDLMATYYSQRASAGLIITEGVSPSPNGLGYARIPGLFNQDHVQGWKKVAQAVHSKGGKIFVQLMHCGRVAHPLNMPAGAKILAPSAIAVSGQMWTDAKGMQAYPVPQEMDLVQIKQAISEYVQASQLAMDAGLDGVELHAANGYLMEQFLNPHCNHRQDEYGSSPEGRMRFVLETAKAVTEKIGANKTGIRISPYGVFNDTGAFAGIDEFYLTLTQKLSDLGLAYIHVVDHASMGAPVVSADLKQKIRANFKALTILSGGYDAKRAEHDLQQGLGDLVAFGRPFISNPDLVEKLQANQALKDPDQSTFYTAEAKGYTDY